jgi:glycosyltransferase involved in cell wall biosynthesis
MGRLDPRQQFIQYRGPVCSAELPGYYHQSSAFVFASSCENMPNILLEAMAAGLPIACSKRGPMPEVLGEAGVYFDPDQPREIAAALSRLFSDPSLRERCAGAAYERSLCYSWERCARETLAFLSAIGRGETR